MEAREERIVSIGFYDSQVDLPTYDEAYICPVCNENLRASMTRAVISILIHCTRWPLCTFLRFHQDELAVISDSPRYHEIVAEALAQRDRIERESLLAIPAIFKNAFLEA